MKQSRKWFTYSNCEGSPAPIIVAPAAVLHLLAHHLIDAAAAVSAQNG
jgi:hypothetical protein